MTKCLNGRIFLYISIAHANKYLLLVSTFWVLCSIVFICTGSKSLFFYGLVWQQEGNHCTYFLSSRGSCIDHHLSQKPIITLVNQTSLKFICSFFHVMLRHMLNSCLLTNPLRLKFTSKNLVADNLKLSWFGNTWRALKSSTEYFEK